MIFQRRRFALVCAAVAALLPMVIGIGAQAATTGTTVSAGKRGSLDNSTGNLPYIDTTKLSICPPPAPQVVSATPIKVPSLTDPAAPRCAVVPKNVGLHLEGMDNSVPLRLDESNIGTFTQLNGSLDPIKRTACPISSPCLNGVGQVAATSVQNRAIAATLYAQTPTLYGSAEVYNWIGLQNNANGGNLAQIGISYNNLSSLGTQVCSGNNDVNYRPMILGQAEINGSYLTGICFPEYVFGPGTQTWFAVTTSGNGWWDNWVNWNGVWQVLVSYNQPALTPATARLDLVPAEITQVGLPYVAPSLPSIPDQQAQHFDGTNWLWWFPDVPTGTIQTGGYCVSTPTAYTNVTANDSGC